MLSLVTWRGGECWASPLQLPFILLPTRSLWEGVNLHSLHLRRAEFFFTFLRAGCLHNLFGILRKSFSLLYLLIQSFISEWIHGYLFYTLGYNPILLNFVDQIVPTLAIGSSEVLLLYPIHCGF